MRSIAKRWELHRAAELDGRDLETLDPVATALIAYLDASRTVALAIEREELTPEEVIAEVDQALLKIQDMIQAQREAAETANDDTQTSQPEDSETESKPET